MHTVRRSRRVVVATLAMVTAFALAGAQIAAAKPGDNGGPGNSGAATMCQKGGWQHLARTGSETVPFASQGECVSYGAQGGELAGLLWVEILWGPRDPEVDLCSMSWQLHNPLDGKTVHVETFFNNGYIHWYLDGSFPVAPAPTISNNSFITSSPAIVVQTDESVITTYPSGVCPP